MVINYDFLNEKSEFRAGSYDFLNEKSEFHSEIPHSAGHADRQAGRLVKYGY